MLGAARHLQRFRRNHYSQSGEDGLLDHVLSALPRRDSWCVEFGAWDGKHLSNTYNLIANRGYKAVLIEADPAKYETLTKNMSSFSGVVCRNVFVDARGPNALDNVLRGTGIPRDFDLLSVDIDGNDYFVWEGLTEYVPKVVIIEINVKNKPTVRKVHEPGSPFVWGVSGTSILAMTELAHRKGYALIAHVGTNAVFVRREFLSAFHEAEPSPRQVFTYEGHSLRELDVPEVVPWLLGKVTRSLARLGLG